MGRSLYQLVAVGWSFCVGRPLWVSRFVSVGRCVNWSLRVGHSVSAGRFNLTCKQIWLFYTLQDSRKNVQESVGA